MASSAVLIVASWALLRHRRELEARTLELVVLLTVAGVLLAAGLRIVTAGVNGANIGGAAVLFVGFPLVGVLVVAAVTRYVRAGRRPADDGLVDGIGARGG